MFEQRHLSKWFECLNSPANVFRDSLERFVKQVDKYAIGLIFTRKKDQFHVKSIFIVEKIVKFIFVFFNLEISNSIIDSQVSSLSSKTWQKLHENCNYTYKTKRKYILKKT